jgi:hypothetical protein
MSIRKCRLPILSRDPRDPHIVRCGDVGHEMNRGYIVTTEPLLLRINRGDGFRSPDVGHWKS